MAKSKAEPNLEQENRVEKVFRRWQDAREGLSAWREEARESYAFDAGDQWSSDDRAWLEEQERPAVTFNRGGVMIDAVAGLEVNSRQQVTYLPREQGDVAVAEVETAAAHWVNEQCHAEDEESEAFRDALICGVGVTETLMEYDDDPDGEIMVQRRDPMKAFWDPAAQKKCNSDARFVFYADWMDNKLIEQQWPDKFKAITPWDSLDEGSTPQNADLMFLYKDTDNDFEKHKDQSLVVQYQCFERVPMYRVMDPETGEHVFMEEKKFKLVSKAYREATGGDLQYVRQMKKKYYRGFYCGKTELEYKESPCQAGFTFKFITAKRDRNKKMWYGIWRAMKDPQRWANKWLSQILHIINTNAKGGAFVESNALKDPRKAEEQWAASNPLIELNEGGINKIKERTPANTPSGLDKLMNFAFESLPYVTGINLEALGLANREQAGVLEAQRRKAAYGILAPLFDSLRLYRKEQGELLFYFIREFISDGRLIRVLGQNGQNQYQPLTRKSDSIKYDLIVDQSPHSPDFKEKTWEAMKELLPVMMKEGLPIPPSAFDYAPVPSQLSNEIKKMMQQRGQVPPQVQEQMQQMQQALQQYQKEIQSLQQENNNLKVGAQIDILKVHAKHAEQTQKLEAKEREVQLKAAVERANAVLDAKVQAIVAQAKMDSEERRQVTQMLADFKMKILDAATSAETGTRVAVDGASAVAKPLVETIKQLENAVKDIGKTHAETKKIVDSLEADRKKKRKRKAIAKPATDGSYVMEVVEE